MLSREVKSLDSPSSPNGRARLVSHKDAKTQKKGEVEEFLYERRVSEWLMAAGNVWNVVESGH